MLSIDSIVLYVENVQLSMSFYAQAFECEPKLLSPTTTRVSMPIGWLTQSLTVEPLGKINAQSKYATGFNKPE